ncbi:MAG: hypothetical protein CBB92_07655 [Flammeovirgaceae bacterium TMED32]|nr:DNA gyrase inhibitor YacG [Rhodospirillaceae bacterium]OUT97980.1 MAG: hypothetical protein CBB92_07655 [Flammeovirgaceae bacterium TMED32]
MSNEPACPVCGRSRTKRHRPFCSKRCAEFDLGRWFTGAYAIPSEEMPDEFDIGMADQVPDDDSYQN